MKNFTFSPVSSGFSSFLPLSKTYRQGDWLRETAPRCEWVCECTCTIPCDGLTCHLQCILWPCPTIYVYLKEEKIQGTAGNHQLLKESLKNYFPSWLKWEFVFYYLFHILCLGSSKGFFLILWLVILWPQISLKPRENKCSLERELPTKQFTMKFAIMYTYVILRSVGKFTGFPHVKMHLMVPTFSALLQKISTRTMGWVLATVTEQVVNSSKQKSRRTVIFAE